MTANPIETAIVDGVAVSKGDFRSYEKTRVRQRFATVSEVRSATLTLQQNIYVATLYASFDLDTSDTTSADDGVNCIIDAAGNRFRRRNGAEQIFGFGFGHL